MESSMVETSDRVKLHARVFKPADPILGPRLGYLPLLVPIIKAHFSSTLPPGTDTVWFDYKGRLLKWSIPTGVLFDLLCAEPERPWNLTCSNSRRMATSLVDDDATTAKGNMHHSGINDDGATAVSNGVGMATSGRLLSVDDDPV
uniref:Autophagy protein ATG5 UblA domain-containing protein n=1 Tax=Ananas comosus var. bracteatus TaxID=296719 RepID=A0A6V7QD91_ANACO|nr:unnamed protein product [Ananas comosus var. bracteatus]